MLLHTQTGCAALTQQKPGRPHNAHSLCAPILNRDSYEFSLHEPRADRRVLHKSHISRAITSSSSSTGSSSTGTGSTQEAGTQPSTSGRQHDAAEAAGTSTLVTFEEMVGIAAARGLHLSLKTLGPFYRITCRDGGPEGRILGVTNGFVAPLFGLMHCDTLQIFTRGMKGQEAERVRKNALGLGLLLGGAVFSFGRSCGCTKAEILAINDDDAWHERLVRYYSYFGFQPVCRVGGQGFFKDVPHLLVWGGEGTRMDADIEASLQRWTPALRQSRQKAQQKRNLPPATDA